MVKNIIFDLSEVIISGYHGTEKVVAQNTDLSAEEFLARKTEVTDFFLDTMRGKYSEDEYCAHLLEGTGWDLSTQKVKECVRQNLNVPVEGTLEIIKRLKGKYRLILLSDHVREWAEYILENNRELEIFDQLYFTYEYGLLKADEGCFEYVLKDSGSKPEETIFIDDYFVNIDKAKECGIDSILFKNAKDLEQELKRRGIL